MSDHYENMPWEEALKNTANNSIYWNVHPIHSESMDIYTALNHISLIVRKFKRNLLENQAFETETKVLFRSSDKLNSIYFTSKNQQELHGLQSFGFGYPLYIARHKKDKEKLIVAPLFIWHLELKPDAEKHDKWHIIHHPEMPLSYNKYLLQYWNEEYKMDFKPMFEEFVRNKNQAHIRFNRFMEKMTTSLRADGSLPPNEIIACPLQNTMARMSRKSSFHWSGALSLFPPQMDRIFGKLQAIPEKKIDPKGTNKIANLSQHNFGLWPNDPDQQEVLEAYPKAQTILIKAATGTGKTYLISNIISNLLSNGKTCLVISPTIDSQKIITEKFAAHQLNDFLIPLNDPILDRQKFRQRVQLKLNKKTRYSTFNAKNYNNALSNAIKEKTHLDSLYTSLRKIQFGPYTWEDTVGLFLGHQRLEAKELLEDFLKKENFKLTHQEYAIILKDLKICQSLYQKINTLEHPLKELHSSNFKTQAIPIAHRAVDNKIEHNLQQLKQLKYRYVLKIDQYKKKAEARYQQKANQFQTKIDHLISTIEGYTVRYGSSFGQSNGPLKVFSIFSKKHKTMLLLKSDILEEYQKLEKYFEKDSLYKFSFVNRNQHSNILKIRQNVFALQKSLHQWLAQVPQQVAKESNKINGKNVPSILDLKEDFFSIEQSFQERFNELNTNELYQEAIPFTKEFLADKLQLIETTIQQLENTKKELNAFPDFYKWQHYWLKLPDTPRRVVTALTKTEAINWQAAFGSWYINQFLISHHDSNVSNENADDTAYLKAIQNLVPQLSSQIEDYWLKRKNKTVLKKIVNAKNNSLSELMEIDFENLKNHFPVFLCSPDFATEVLPVAKQLFDYVIFDDAQQLTIEKAIPCIQLAEQIIITGDPLKLGFLNGNSLLEYAEKVSQKQIHLNYQHQKRPFKILKFKDSAFGLDQHFINTGSGMYTPCSEVAAVNGIFKEKKQVNEEECMQIIQQLLDLKLTPEHSFALVNIVCFSRQQCTLISDRLLELKQGDNDEAQKIKTLYKAGLAVHLIKDLGELHPDILLVSFGFGINYHNDELTSTIAILNTIKGLTWLNLLFSGNYHKIFFYHSLPKEFIASKQDTPDERGVFLLTNFIQYLDAIGQADLQTQRAIIRKIKLRTVDQATPNPFLKEVARSLSSYFDTNRIKLNTTIGNTKLPLVIKAKYKGQAPIVLQADGSFFPASKNAYEWEKEVRESISFLGLKLINLWSPDWWNDPEQSARKLASEIIKYDTSFELEEV